MIIGLTGGIATGKSTVTDMLRKLAIPIVDADVIAREVVEPGKEAFNEIVGKFGNDILTKKGTIDRKKLGAIVFNNEEKRLQLNSIVHPAIRKEMKRQRDELISTGYDTVIMDIPLLIESKLQNMVDKVIVVYVPFPVQLERLMERDHISEEEALQRIQSQLPIEEKKELADAVINNEGSLLETEKQVRNLLKKWNIHNNNQT